MSTITIDIDDQDIESTTVDVYDDVMFINQVERGSGEKHCVLMNMTSALQLRDALNQFLRIHD